MKKLLAFLMLFVGLGLAAAYGARNGDTHATYRQALSEVPAIQAERAALEATRTELDAERQRLTEASVEQATQWAAEDAAALEADPEYLAPERVDGFAEDLAALDEQEHDLHEALEDAGARLATLEAATLPQPSQRLSEWFSVGGIGWLGGVALIIAGAVLARREIEAENRGEGASEDAEVVDFLANVQETRRRLAQLTEDIAELGMDDDAPKARALIDATFDELLEPIVESRGRFTARHGVGVFASYFGSFAGGERNLSRTWSALTDGHAVEARASLAKAVEAFAEAEAAWHKAEGA